MSIIICAGLEFLLMLALVLLTVLLVRPESFRFKATLTKWVSLDLEMRSKLQSSEVTARPSCAAAKCSRRTDLDRPT